MPSNLDEAIFAHVQVLYNVGITFNRNGGA